MKGLFFQGVRFLGIGFLNTAVDFAVLNFLATAFSIYQGVALGVLNVCSFSIAVIHSYLWNKNWAFVHVGKEDYRIWQDALKFIFAASLGGAALALVIWGAEQKAGSAFYLLVLGVLAIGEIVLWKAFKISKSTTPVAAKQQFVVFVGVTLVGVLVNSGIVSVATEYIDPLFGMEKELWLNMVKAAATGVSLVWNFLGYKIFVFRD